MFGPDGPRGARLGGSGIVGLLTFVVALAPLGPAVAAVLGWILGAGVFVAWTLWVLGRLDGPGVQTHATREDSTRVVSDLILIGGSIASLAGVGVLLASQRGQGGTPWEAVLGVLCVVVSWVLVHTVYLLRYAALYYRGTAGGIDFNQAEPPDYHDFAYLAFTLGMTYQVSDTAISSDGRSCDTLSCPTCSDQWCWPRRSTLSSSWLVPQGDSPLWADANGAFPAIIPAA